MTLRITCRPFNNRARRDNGNKQPQTNQAPAYWCAARPVDMQRVCWLDFGSLTCRDTAPGTKYKGRAAQAHSKGRTCGVSKCTFPCCRPFYSQQQQSTTQRWVHQREAQGPTPLKTAAKLCRRHNTTFADKAGRLGQSRADDV